MPEPVKKSTNNNQACNDNGAKTTTWNGRTITLLSLSLVAAVFGIAFCVGLGHAFHLSANKAYEIAAGLFAAAAMIPMAGYNIYESYKNITKPPNILMKSNSNK